LALVEPGARFARTRGLIHRCGLRATGSRLQRRQREPGEDPERLKETGRNRANLRDAGVTPQRAGRSCPYLSTLQPHFGHVHPPHIASAIDAGLRIAGMDVPQRGQAGLSDPMPHRPFVFDCLTTKKPTSTAAIPSAMNPMPSMTRCAFPPDDCYARARRTTLLARRLTARSSSFGPGRGPLLRGLIGSRPAAQGGTHVTTKGPCIWPNLQDFGVDVGAVFPIVALGKPAPMPYVWHPRRETERGNGRSEHRRCPQKWWKCLTP
jgi:hypothetical protein